MKLFDRFSDKKLLGIIFLLALVIRIGFILTLDNSVDVWGDWWDELGWKLATGQGFWVNNPYFHGGIPFYSWRTPGFSLFLAVIYKIFGHSFLAAKIGLAVLSSLICILLYPLGKILINKKAGIVCAVIYSIYPASIFWTGYLAPTTLAIFIMLLFVIFLIYAEKYEKKHFFFLTGIFLGMGVLTRSLFFIFLPVIPLWLIFKNRRIVMKGTLFSVLGCFLIISPWTIRNYKILKEFVLTSTEGGIVCYIANNQNSLSQPSGYWNPPIEKSRPHLKGLSEIEIDHYFYKKAFKFIKTHPKTYFKLVVDRFLRYWRLYPHTFSGPGENYKWYHVVIGFITFAPLVVFGFLGFIKSLKRRKDFLVFYLLILAWSLPVILFFKTVIRYREPISPFLIVLGVLFFKKNVEK